MTSILRTYYTWKITYAPDVSYYTMIVGLWTDAELATGILVCCLPVTPRFFQHVGPKIYKTFSLGSRYGSKSGKKVGSKETDSRRKGWSFKKQTTLKHSLGLNSFPETWAARSSKPDIDPDNDYITLDNYNTTTPLKTHLETKRGDLESGMDKDGL